MTGGAAAGAIGWMRRLAAHRAVGEALAGGRVSESWAKQICHWSDLLPEDCRGDADQILLGAAAGGASLRDLGELAEELHKRTARPDDDDDDGFDDRCLQLSKTFRGAGKLNGDLTPQCAAALAAVLEALGKRAGPQDLRSKWQRDHDAFEEACRRPIAAGTRVAALQATRACGVSGTAVRDAGCRGWLIVPAYAAGSVQGAHSGGGAWTAGGSGKVVPRVARRGRALVAGECRSCSLLSNTWSKHVR